MNTHLILGIGTALVCIVAFVVLVPLHVTGRVPIGLAADRPVAELATRWRPVGLQTCYGGTPSKNREAASGYDYPTAPLAILSAMLSARSSLGESIALA